MLRYPGSLIKCDVRFFGTCVKAMFTTMLLIGTAIGVGNTIAQLLLEVIK